MVIRRAYFRKYNRGAFKKILGWGSNAEEALFMAMGRGMPLVRRGYRCVGGEDITC